MDISKNVERVDLTKEIEVFPNPTTGYVVVAFDCESGNQYNVSIKDAWGRILHSENLRCAQHDKIQQKIDMTEFPPGVYFLELTYSSQHIVKKIVKLQ